MDDVLIPKLVETSVFPMQTWGEHDTLRLNQGVKITILATVMKSPSFTIFFRNEMSHSERNCIATGTF
ncbi:hypothetical protein EG68_06592 [Paragonimus skrjabini miyazakii]|uniref:Uncharacterized protein n=1 Tax=Paragonimus skrjabini miyazakii TaxID=59628 RepID=A0A8S9YSZ9_9TREM|nr:hypothetical protein EG68_06592 [Paragonimus skrjabini miyazakii]